MRLLLDHVTLFGLLYDWCDAETGILWENLDNTMVADALASGDARASAAMVLTL